MFDLNEKYNKLDMCPDGWGSSSSYVKETIIKEKLILNKNENQQFDFVIDTLELLKKSDGYQPDMITYEKNGNKLTILFKYKENLKNIEFVEIFQSFINKYQNKSKNNIIKNL